MMKIEILGAGCFKCKKVYENVKKALEETGVDADVEKIEDMNKIINYGVMITPALVIDGKIKASGRIPNHEEIKIWLQE